MKVSVPGKLVLLGEYAVLNGTPALVAAVDRRAEASNNQSERKPSAVVRAVCAQAQRDLETTDIDICSTAFRNASGSKLGIGSSAAAAVSAAILLRGHADDQALQWALDGHKAASGGVGSGIDVLACFHGGVIATTKQPAPFEKLPLKLPGLHLAVFFLKKSATTKSMVLACQNSPNWNSLTKDMAETAQAGIEAWKKLDARAFLEKSRAYGLQMQRLGENASVPIVTDEMTALMRLADEYDAAAKPSGAGGGDVALVWALDLEVLDRIDEQSSALRLSLALTDQGALCVGT